VDGAGSCWLLVVGSHGLGIVGVVYGRWMKLAVVGSHGLGIVGVVYGWWMKLAVVGFHGQSEGEPRAIGKRPTRLLVCWLFGYLVSWFEYERFRSKYNTKVFVMQMF